MDQRPTYKSENLKTAGKHIKEMDSQEQAKTFRVGPQQEIVSVINKWDSIKLKSSAQQNTP